MANGQTFNRQVQLYTPNGYVAGTELPFMVVHDGSNDTPDQPMEKAAVPPELQPKVPRPSGFHDRDAARISPDIRSSAVNPCACKFKRSTCALSPSEIRARDRRSRAIVAGFASRAPSNPRFFGRLRALLPLG